MNDSEWLALKSNERFADYRHLNDTLCQSAIYLRIDKQKHIATIRGSLRKWYYGGDSLKDFNKDSFLKAILKLARTLRIPPSEIGKAKFTNCEIGLNLRTKTEPIEIISKIVGYKCLRRNDKYQSVGTLYFGSQNSSRKLVLYDKQKEIEDKQKQANQTITLSSPYSKRKDHFTLRIELRLNDHKSWQELHVGYIETIGDLWANWSNLYEIWTHEISYLVVFSGINKDKCRGKDFLLAELLENRGLHDALEELCKRSNAKSAKGIKTARHKHKERLLYIIMKYGNRKVYNNISFRCEITKCLLSRSKSEDIGLLFLCRLLWKPVFLNNKKEK